VTYTEFLATKQRRVAPDGIDVADDAIHPLLFPFQRHLVRWALHRGRAAIFADCGLGKSLMQIEWARLTGRRTLILAPLAVAQQTIREAAKVDVELPYARHQDEAGEALTITNYERLHRFDPAAFGAVVADESSILKSIDGKIRTALLTDWRAVPWRLACTATPAPNDETELANHAEWLGAMSRVDMLASYFVHDDDGWRLKGHAAEPMYQWMAGWAAALRRPSDLGYDDTGYDLPPLRIIPQVVAADVVTDGQLFATDLGGVGGRARVRRLTLDARTERALELAANSPEQWIVWCGLNDEANTVTRECPGAVNVEGAMAPEAKAEALLAFADGQIRVLVSKPSVSGHGMNFQNCARVAFLGLSDSWEAYYQAIRRCWRFGQTRPVEAHVVVSELESAIVDNIRAKEAQSGRMTDQLVRHLSQLQAA
jgi:hypothetical protein